MKLKKESIRKSYTNTERKKIFMNKSVENLKLLDYSTLQEEEDSNLLKEAIEEYKDLFPEILLLSQKDFFSCLEKYIQISLFTSEKIFPNAVMNKVLYIIEKKYYNEDKHKIKIN